MKAEEIIKYAARNLGSLASDNQTIREGIITRAGLLDELNRIYIDVVSQHMMEKVPDEFLVEARRPLYRGAFTPTAFNPATNILSSAPGIFGTADVGYSLYRMDTGERAKITSYITGTLVKVSGVTADWVGKEVYILTNIVLLDGDMSDAKDIKKVQIRYGKKGEWRNGEYTTLSNLKDISDNESTSQYETLMYSVSTIEVNDVMNRCIRYSPFITDPFGEVKITYSQLPSRLSYDTVPLFSNMGISEVLINGLTAWGFKALGQFDKAQVYEESNPVIGGVVPKGMTYIHQKFKMQKNKPITFKNIWRR